jgi:hypothetical protein
MDSARVKVRVRRASGTRQLREVNCLALARPQAPSRGIRPAGARVQRGWCRWGSKGPPHTRLNAVAARWVHFRSVQWQRRGSARGTRRDQLQRSGRSFPISARNIFSSAGFKSVLPSSCRRAQPFTMSCNFCWSNPSLPLVATYSATRRRQLSRSAFVKCMLATRVLALG